MNVVQGCHDALQRTNQTTIGLASGQAIKHLHDDVATISRLMKQSLRYRLVRETI
jgi:hypothetical protein